MNRVVLAGRITRDPELQNPTSDNMFVRFSIAVDRQTKGANGERQADFFNCVAFRQRADFISKYVRKGNMIIIDGKLQNNTFTGQDGVTRTTTDIIVDNVQNVEPRQQTSQEPQYRSEQSQNTYSNNAYQQNKTTPYQNQGNNRNSYEVEEDDSFSRNNTSFVVSDDDLPF